MENADALFVDLNVHIAYGLQLARRVFYCVTTTRTGNFGDIEDTFSPNRITCFFLNSFSPFNPVLLAKRAVRFALACKPLTLADDFAISVNSVRPQTWPGKSPCSSKSLNALANSS